MPRLPTTASYADTLPNHDFAIIVDPPYVEAPPEEPSARCSTECPGAHGKIYQTESGEVSPVALVSFPRPYYILLMPSPLSSASRT